MAGAGSVYGLVIHLVTGVADLQIAVAREDGAVACIAGRHHAVKHVHAVGNALHQVFGRTHAHQVARLVGGQQMRRVGHDLQHLVLGLAHGDAAHGIAGEIDFQQTLQRFLAQIGVHAALHNAEQGIGVLQALELLLGALGPATAHLHGLACFGLGGLLAVGLVGRALVEPA